MLRSRLTLCDPMDYSPPVSSVRGILQAAALEWLALTSSRGSSRPRDQIHLSYVSCVSRWVLYHWATWEAPFYLIMAPKSSDAGNLDVPKRSHKVLPLSEEMRALELIRKEKNHMLRLLRSVIRTNLLSEILENQWRLLSHFKLYKLRPPCMMSAQLRQKWY